MNRSSSHLTVHRTTAIDRRLRVSRAMGPAIALLALAGMATGQADFSEAFDSNGPTQAGQEGPSGLIGQGWVFRNQSSPAEGPAWYDGDGFGGEAFEGPGYLQCSSLATDFFGGAVSCWAVLPDIPGLAAGDTVTLWILGGGAFSSDTFFEIRYAPGGGSGTGDGPSGTGDFSQVLASFELPVSVDGYQRVTAQVPGDGRLALRFHSPFLMSFAGNGATFSVDSLTVGDAPSDPCGLVIPNAGETAVWTAAAGPYTVCQDLLIPAGARVELEPGASIDFSGGTLRVEGSFVAAGTAGAPVQLSGVSGFSPGLEVAVSGAAEISFAQIATKIAVSGENASMVLTDSTVSDSGLIEGVPDLVVVERCHFDGGALGGFSQMAGSIRVVDSSFTNGGLLSIGGLLYLDNLTLDGAALSIAGENVAHPTLLDRITVSNNPSTAGLTVRGANYLLGPDFVSVNNLYPIAMTLNGAGILHESTPVLSPNTNGYINVESMGLTPQREWADLGLPYVVDGFPVNGSGQLIVEPGTTIRFRPDAGSFVIGAAELVLEGTREHPIVLESFNPFQRWFGIKWLDNFDAQARHTIFDGGQISVQSDGGVIDLIQCTVRDSLEGTVSVTSGTVNLLSTRIINNIVGMRTTQTGRINIDGAISPSILENNGVAIEYNNINTLPYLRYNWWGSPTGPTDALNPGGAGDPVDGLHPATYTPFLASPPPLDDDFPVVEMMPTYFMATAGDKIILRWSSSDDGAIAEHRVEFADHDFPNEFRTIATLPPDVLTYEFTVPSVAPNNLYPTPSAIRIVAVDDAGQESWDKSVLRIPYQEDWTVIPQVVSDPGEAHPHDTVDVCWAPGGLGDVFLLLDGLGMTSAEGGSNVGCLPIGSTLTYSSTDTARYLVLTTFGAGGRLHYSFSDYFTIRPDSRFGDEPPVIEVTAPAVGASFPGGGVIPVRWTASDDEGLRSFRVQASFDGGRAWHMIATDLPAETRAFDWDLPESTGIDDVRIRVVAFDHRFQDSASLAGPVVITAGAPCPADLAAPFGVLDLADVQAFIAGFVSQTAIADLAPPLGVFDLADVQAFIASFTAGCP